MMVMIMLFPLSFINYGRGVRVTDAYLGGANVHSSARFLRFTADAVQDVTIGNYYLRGFFSEAVAVALGRDWQRGAAGR